MAWRAVRGSWGLKARERKGVGGGNIGARGAPWVGREAPWWGEHHGRGGHHEKGGHYGRGSGMMWEGGGGSLLIIKHYSCNRWYLTVVLKM